MHGGSRPSICRSRARPSSREGGTNMFGSEILRRAVHGGVACVAPLASCARSAPKVEFWPEWQRKRAYYAHRGDAPAWVPFSAIDFTGRYVAVVMTIEVPKGDLFEAVSSRGLALVDRP